MKKTKVISTTIQVELFNLARTKAPNVTMAEFLRYGIRSWFLSKQKEEDINAQLLESLTKIERMSERLNKMAQENGQLRDRLQKIETKAAKKDI